jgi:hypothetical protein
MASSIMSTEGGSLMRAFTKRILFVIAGALLLAASAHVAQAQRIPGIQRDQLYFISGSIRWKKDMGIIPAGPHNSQPAASPCGQMWVAATDPSSGKEVTKSSSMNLQPDDGDYHVCSYSFKMPGNRRVYMIAGMGGTLLLPKLDDSPMYWTDPWIGGSRPQPPGGAIRGFTGYKYVTLTPQRRRAVANFELLYVRKDDPH